MQQDGFDRRSFLGIHAQTGPDQIPESIVLDFLESFYGFLVLGIDNLLRIRQQIENDALGLSAKIIGSRRQFIKQHAQTPGIVILLDLEFVSHSRLFGHCKFRWTGLGRIILGAGSRRDGGFQIDSLDVRIATTTTTTADQYKIFRLEVGPDQSARVHRLDTPGNTHGGLAQSTSLQTTLCFGQKDPQVLIAGFQNERRVALGNALGGFRRVDVWKKGNLFDITRTRSL
mmetsp:Transcript_109/g.260  ORF Transcript_109/g.260 Transcript_109/m.260 type:complete len:229 (+) Transcript_109:187-873(+)